MSQHPGYPVVPGSPQGAPQFQPPGGARSAPQPWPQQPWPQQPWPQQSGPQQSGPQQSGPQQSGPQQSGPQQAPSPSSPAPYGLPPQPQPRSQRPAVIAMAATMTVTASLQWICVLSFAWLVATAGAASLSTTDVEGALYHMLRRFHLRMVEGLALPLYGFPALAFVLGFVILAPRPWTRIALTATGLATLAWSGWWLRQDILWWLPAALYIGIVCLILWTPGATQWYRRRGLG